MPIRILVCITTDYISFIYNIHCQSHTFDKVYRPHFRGFCRCFSWQEKYPGIIFYVNDWRTDRNTERHYGTYPTYVKQIHSVWMFWLILLPVFYCFSIFYVTLHIVIILLPRKRAVCSTIFIVLQNVFKNPFLKTSGFKLSIRISPTVSCRCIDSSWIFSGTFLFKRNIGKG